jgi:hypothetical protein
MLQIDNKTSFVASLLTFPDEDGIDALYPVIKATFNFPQGKISIAEKQMPLVGSDQYSGDPGKSSLDYSSDFMPCKPCTDILLKGTAYSPRGAEVNWIDVSLIVNDREKGFRIFGNRFWTKKIIGYSISNPVPFKEMPLKYELAFGGGDALKDETEIFYEYNPVGKGYCHQKGTKEIDGLPLPNIEDPKELIENPKQKPMTSGFGPIAPNWMPRISLAGTYDEKWQKNRAPYLPKDFNPKFYNVSSSDFIFSPYLEGGEEIKIKNLTPDGFVSFRLPKLEFKVILKLESKLIPVRMNLETVLIEPDEKCLTMTWKGKLNCDKKLLKMELATFEIGKTNGAVEGL